MSFLDHLEELRWHLIRSVIAVFVLSIAAFLAKDFVWDYLIFGPAKSNFWTYQMLCKLSDTLQSPVLCIQEIPIDFQNRQLTGQFTMHIKSSLVLGLIVAFPYVFWELWRFIRPGLHKTERRASKGAVFVVSVLFLSGVFFGYYIVAPLSINFLANYQLSNVIENNIDIISFVGVITTLVLACAFMFQLPMVSYFLSKAGIVTPRLMKRYRKHSIVVILLFSAVITPPDVISQVLIALPLALLYEISIFISARVERKEASELKN